MFITYPSIGELTVKIAEGETLTTLYPQISKWTAQNTLYNSLENNPGLLGQNTSVDNFYGATAVTEIHDFYAVKSDITNAWTGLSAELDNLALHSSQLAAYLDTLLDVDALIAINPTTALLQQRENLILNIETESGNIETILTTLASARKVKVTVTKQNNTAVYTNTVFEDNQRTVNDIYLNTIASTEDVTVSETQAAILEYIAGQCPLTGGNAVFQARALYALVSEKDFDDEILCGGNAPMEAFIGYDEEVSIFPEDSKEEIESVQSFLVYPNPANDEIIIEFSLDSKPKLIVLFDAFGKQVYKIIPDESGSHIINTSDVNSGIYFLKLFIEGKRTDFTKKIIITH